jgi:hypothetical protein
MQSIKFRSQIISLIADALCRNQKTESLRNYVYDRIYDSLQQETDDSLVVLMRDILGDEYEYISSTR